MPTPTANLERERLLKLAEEYRDKGYEILIHPDPEDLPDFLQKYSPDLIARHEDEKVVIEVKSRFSLNSSAQYLQSLAQAVERHPDWRFELVMTDTNAEGNTYFAEAKGSLQENEIRSRLKVVNKLLEQHPESAILYSWSLVEATLRLVAEKEGISLRSFVALYLVKKLAIEGIISQSEYQLLMKSSSLRNAVAHGFKTTQITRDSVEKLIDITEQILKTMHSDKKLD